jgi:uncharacterized protein
MKLSAKQCIKCDKILSIDKYHCTSCWSEELETTQLSGKGEVYSYTNIYAAPEPFTEQAPYFVILVDLEKGPRVTGRYIGEEIKIGDRIGLDSIKDRGYYFKSL